MCLILSQPTRSSVVGSGARSTGGGDTSTRGPPKRPSVPTQTRQLWTQPPSPSPPSSTALNTKTQVTKYMSQLRGQTTRPVGQSTDRGPADSAVRVQRKGDPRAQSGTIYIPEEEKKKHSARLSNSLKGTEAPRREDMVRNDFLLDLTDRHLVEFDASLHHVYPKSKLSMICVLILRGNELTDLKAMRLNLMVSLTDLDLAHNLFFGGIPAGSFPRNIERLDLSNNSFDDFSGLVTCTTLRSVNISHNCLKSITALPSKLEDLDISYNLLSTPLHLRLLSLSPSIRILRIIGNPIVDASAFCRVIVCSVLPNIQQLDDILIPGCGVRRKGPQGKGKAVTAPKVHTESAAVVTKTAQIRRDEYRHAEHARKLKDAERAQENVKKTIRTMSKHSVIGSQATELMVRRLSWVPHNTAAAASFFERSLSPRTGAKLFADERSVGTGTGTGTARGRPLSARSMPSHSYPSRVSHSLPARPRSASATRTSQSSSLRRGECRNLTQSCGRQRDDLNISHNSDSSLFSTFGAARSTSIARSNSAPCAGRAVADDFKAFSRHSELPTSPSKEIKAAGKTDELMLLITRTAHLPLRIQL